MPATSLRPNWDTTAVVGARIGAQIVDLIVTGLQGLGIAFGLALLVRPETEAGLRGLVFVGFLTTPLYGGLLEAYWNGQTIGKRVAGIRLVDFMGEDPSVGQALLRNLPAPVAFGWLTYLVALASVAANDRRQRVFDVVADTYVVRAAQPKRVRTDVPAANRDTESPQRAPRRSTVRRNL